MLLPDEDEARPRPCWNRYLSCYYGQRKSTGPPHIAVLHQLRNQSDELAELADLTEMDNARLRAGFTALSDLSHELRMPAPAAASSFENWRPADINSIDDE